MFASQKENVDVIYYVGDAIAKLHRILKRERFYWRSAYQIGQLLEMHRNNEIGRVYFHIDVW